MTSPAPSGGSSSLRNAGFALVALAVIAAVVGLFSLMTGGQPDDQNLAGGTTTSETAAPPSAVGPTAPPTGTPPEATTIPTYTPPPIATQAPDAGTSGTDTGSSARSPLRVYNNSLIKGLADRAAGEFRAGGWQVDEVGNYPDGIIPTSTVFYRPDEQSAAQALGSQFGLRVEPRSNGLKSATDGLIVIVTKDYTGK